MCHFDGENRENKIENEKEEEKINKINRISKEAKLAEQTMEIIFSFLFSVYFSCARAFANIVWDLFFFLLYVIHTLN